MKSFSFFFVYICFSLVLFSCSGQSSNGSSSMSEEELGRYQSVLHDVQTIESMLPEPGCLSAEQLVQLNEKNSQLSYDFDPMGMDSASQSVCLQLKQRVSAVRDKISQLVEESLPYLRNNVMIDSDHLLEKTETYAVYLERGDSLFVQISAERPFSINIYNADAKSTLLSRSKKKSYSETIVIKNASIYLVEVNPGNQSLYADIAIQNSIPTIERLQSPVRVVAEEVEALKSDWHVRTVKGIKMQNLFDEPRKFTLRGQLKAAFSGSYRAIVAVPVPKGATDILYSLRISTNEGNNSSDGEFHDNMEVSYKKVKMLGLPIYESHRGGGLIATLLGENIPLREEDAYINMYVFYNAAQAKKFQDGANPANLTYSVDYSTLGTQSCNGRIPSKGKQTIYLGFLNERMRYNNYVWLEAVSAVPTTEYFRTQYSKE